MWGTRWSSASDAGGVTAHVACPCLSSLDRDFFFWSSQLEVIGEGEVGEQVVSEGRVCDVPAKTEKKRIRA